VNELARIVEALLFLSPDPLPVEALADACEVGEGEVVEALARLRERGIVEESGRSQFGAVLYRTTALFQKLFGLTGLDQLPELAQFDPSPEDEKDLRERLLRAGEQRAQG
jgi:chromosome segregation and condensation protein ScpB